MRRFIRIFLSLLICFALGCSSLPCAAAAGEAEDPLSGISAGYVPGQVLVQFRPEEALQDPDEILQRSLGEDYSVLDVMDFGEGLVIVLVSSDRYGTEELVRILSLNPGVAAVQPNYVLYPQSTSYSVSDPLNYYQYYVNSPQAENEAGDRTSGRGLDLDEPLSLNMADAWARLSGDEEEVVVAVIDSGVNESHEDLKDILWTNPGNIGLRGEHGFNTTENQSSVNDILGHGSHCTGIIAAQANNGAGIAGVASAANVKVMMVATNHSDLSREEERLNSYREIGAFQYVLRAKLAGVNIVAVSCSWGRSGQSGMYDAVIDRLGEEGVLTFFAAGNEAVNIDYRTQDTSGPSPYRIVVGAADTDGEKAYFSNYGRNQVNLFAPGVNILSAVCYESYFPNIWSREKRSETTAYYGLFDENAVIENGAVTPSVTDCDETVKPFGASVFHAQPMVPPEDGEAFSSSATCELEIVKDHTFTKTDRPTSLKVTIHNATPGEDYYLFFPYEKDPETTAENTDFSLTVQYEMLEGDMPYGLDTGEVIMNPEDGTCELYNIGIEETNPGLPCNKCITHASKAHGENDLLISADEMEEGSICGIGVKVCLCYNDYSQPADLHFYVDSVAVSKPGAEISTQDAYDLMSGTSMATPAAAGAYAVLASLYPRQEGQSGAEYALEMKARLFSCVRITDGLKDLCSTGGYLDMRLLDAGNPALTRMACDVEKGDVILSGINLREGYTLSWRKTGEKDTQSVALPSGGMIVEYAEDGKTLTVHGAKELFSSLVEFTLTEGDTLRAKVDDFLVKGQPALPKVWEELHMKETDGDLRPAKPTCLLGSAESGNLYGFDLEKGALFRCDGTQFSEVRGTDLEESLLIRLQTEGWTSYDTGRNWNVAITSLADPVYTENRLYHWVKADYSPAADADPEESFTRYYIASMDYTVEKPFWSFTETKEWEELFGMDYCDNICLAGLGGKIYCLGIGSSADDPEETAFMFSFDPASGEWTREAPLPVTGVHWMLASGNGKIYATLGLISEKTGTHIQNRRCPDIFAFDGTAWEQLPAFPYVGDKPGGDPDSRARGAFTVTGSGLLFINCPADGGGNCFLYHPEDGSIEPLYETLSGYMADMFQQCSAATTGDVSWFLEERESDGNEWTLRLYRLPLNP